MKDVPGSTLTLLFSDIEGSTSHLRELRDGYAATLERHRELFRAAFDEHGGTEVSTNGDSFFAVFSDAAGAVRAAFSAQRAIESHEWPGRKLRVRIGLHTGVVASTGDNYVGLPVHEAARIMSAGHGGQVLVSDTTKALIDHSIDKVQLRDLGQHRLKDFDRPRRLFQLEHPDLESEFPPLRTASESRGNLPSDATSFVGREKEIIDIAKLIASNKLVTLTGTGGVGKTRLAVRATAAAAESFDEGAWFASLANVGDPAQAAGEIASVLGIAATDERPIEQALTDTIGRRAMLIVLDNCEHVIDAAATLAESILERCPNVALVTTSREPLGVAGEVVFRVPSLGVQGDAIDELGEAARLFIERAASADAGFAVNEAAGHIASIVRQVDGIPLAIELAAAHTRTLTCAEIDERLSDQFRLLAGGARRGVERHRTLRALIDWSYDLLEANERLAFERLSVFAGSFSLAAAESVAGDHGIDRRDVLAALERLVNKSLVIADRTRAATRFRLLEPVRQYALDRLIDSGDADRCRAAHLHCYHLFARDARKGLSSEALNEWLELIDQDLDNVRAAIAWSLIEPAHRVSGLQILVDLFNYWHVRAYWKEPLAQILDAVASPAELPIAILAEAVFAALWLSYCLDEVAVISPIAADAHARARTEGDPKALALTVLALDSATAGKLSMMEECETIARSLGDDELLMFTLFDWGVLKVMQNPAALDECVGYLKQGLGLARVAGNRFAQATTLDTLGYVHAASGDLATGARFFNEARPVLDCTWFHLELDRELGEIALQMGDLDTAEALCRQSSETAATIGWQSRVALCRCDLAVIALTRGDLTAAHHFLDEAKELQSSQTQPGIAMVEGELSFLENQFDEAEAAFSRAIQAANFSAFGLEVLATVGLARAALARTSPDAGRAALLLGNIRGRVRAGHLMLDPFTLGRYEAAMSSLRQALSPEHSEQLMTKGERLDRATFLKLARNPFEKANEAIT